MVIAARIPDELRSAPFLGREAVDGGLLTRRQLQSTAWVRLLRGVYVHREAAMDDAVRGQALRLRLRAGDVLTGRTAAWMHGVWQPRPGAAVPWEVTGSALSDARDSSVARHRFVLRGTDACHRVRDGSLILDEDVTEVGGVPTVSAVRCCFDLMRARGLVESVVVADAFLRAGVVDPLVLAAYAADRHRWPNVRSTRTALSLTCSGSRSPGESRLRMVVVLGGLPEPLVNVPVVGEDDRVLGIPDLTVLGPTRPVGLEYDGSYHETDHQSAADRRRENGLLAGAGLVLLRFDRVSLARGRDAVLTEICQTSGCRARAALLARDFRRAPPPRSW